METSDLLNKRLFAIKNQRLGGDVEELALIIGKCSLLREHYGLTRQRW